MKWSFTVRESKQTKSQQNSKRSQKTFRKQMIHKPTAASR